MQCQHMTTVLEHVGATHVEKLVRGGGAPHSSANGAAGHGATVVSVNGVALPRGQRMVLSAGDNLVFSSPNPRSRLISFVRTLPSLPTTIRHVPNSGRRRGHCWETP